MKKFIELKKGDCIYMAKPNGVTYTHLITDIHVWENDKDGMRTFKTDSENISFGMIEKCLNESICQISDTWVSTSRELADAKALEFRTKGGQ